MMIKNPNINLMMVDEDLVVDCAGFTWQCGVVVIRWWPGGIRWMRLNICKRKMWYCGINLVVAQKTSTIVKTVVTLTVRNVEWDIGLCQRQPYPTASIPPSYVIIEHGGRYARVITCAVVRLYYIFSILKRYLCFTNE